MTDKEFRMPSKPGINKVSPVPSWESYAGFSYLFDNPNPQSNLQNNDGLLLLNNQVHLDDNITLYHSLSQCVQRIGGDDLINKYLFFPLPPSTYHLTIWDGVNIENKNDLSEEGQNLFSSFFKNPRSLNKLDNLLVTNTFNEILKLYEGIELRFKNLRLGGSTVLLAELEPVDIKSQEKLNLLIKERRRLDDEYHTKYNKPYNSIYIPHIALGYYSNIELCERSWKAQSFEWIDIFEKLMQGSKIEYKSISLYGFSDMLTYFKQA